MVTQTMGEFYEEEGETRMRELATVLEPLIIIAMGVFVAVVVLAVMLPMFDFATFGGGEEISMKSAPFARQSLAASGGVPSGLRGASVPARSPGEVREQPAPAAFKSGEERSEIVLRDIADTLLRMEARLERIEAAATHVAAEVDKNSTP